MTQIKSNPLFELKKIPQQSRSKATVDAILDAAIQLLLSDSYDKTSTNRVAERAGISIGSLYEYFPGKEAIFAEIRRREDRKLYRTSAQNDLPVTIKEMLELHITTHIDLVRSNLKLHVALAREVPQFAVVNAEADILSTYLPPAQESFNERRQQLRDHRDPVFLAEFIIHVLRGTINEYLLHSPERIDEKFARELLDMLEAYVID